MQKENVNHPSHYGGEDNTYEAIKVIEAWNLGFNLGNTAKYISRAEKKNNALEDLKKARWYLDREIEKREKNQTTTETKQDNPKSLAGMELLTDRQGHILTLVFFNEQGYPVYFTGKTGYIKL